MDPALQETINRQFNQFNRPLGPKQVDPLGPPYAQIPMRPMFDDQERKGPQMLRGLPLVEEQPPEEEEKGKKYNRYLSRLGGVDDPNAPEEPVDELEEDVERMGPDNPDPEIPQEGALYIYRKDNDTYNIYENFKDQEKIRYLAGKYKTSTDMMKDLNVILEELGRTNVKDVLYKLNDKTAGKWGRITSESPPTLLANNIIEAFNTLPDLRRQKDYLLKEIVNYLPKREVELIQPDQIFLNDWAKRTKISKKEMTLYLRNRFGIPYYQPEGMKKKDAFIKIINEQPKVAEDYKKGLLTKEGITEMIQRKVK
jgi:hypothetical protein